MPGWAQDWPEGVRDEVREQVLLPEAAGRVQRVRGGGAAEGGRPPVRRRAVVHFPGELGDGTGVLEWLLWALLYILSDFIHIDGTEVLEWLSLL